MELRAKVFGELSAGELYEILKARAQVFVVEQTCVYLDPDGKDYDSLHVFLWEDGKVLACLRAFPREEGTVQIGRVLSVEHGKGLGGQLLHEGIRCVREHFHPERIFLEAQCYATGFYEREGFAVCSEVFLEDGIEHVGMVLTCGDE